MEQVEGYICSQCKSDTIVREERNGKDYAICLSCGSEDLLPTCPECNSINIKADRKRAEQYCAKCGLVLSCPPHWVGGDMQVRGAWSFTNNE